MGVRVLCIRGCTGRVNLRMRKRYVDQANVNARLSVNVVWLVQSDDSRGNEPVRVYTNRFGTQTKFFDFFSLRVPAIDRRPQ
uniref:Uncharacterized protein n=1 Tax=Nelumbo nucifera TaxID=4432 RepID=A0A822Z6W1_NELNU|nr:TPA_asm: hypothetical protein HUJ06_014646 [Nelumbo nucifera]